MIFRIADKNDIDAISKIEKDCFSVPWSRKQFEDEIKKNKFAVYIVAQDEQSGEVVGYGGMWHVINEGHITNIAVKEEYRKRGIAYGIIEKLTEIARQREMIGLTLEVRVGNTTARNLYTKSGFKLEGIRKEYYSDTKEDALIMWKYLIDENLIV